MAGGKESPRQKMIGMMYLVLTALLALQISNAVLEKFAIVNETLSAVVQQANQDNAQQLAAIVAEGGKSTVGKIKNAVEKAKQVRELTSATSAYVETLKKEMITTSGQTEINEALITDHSSKVATMMIDTRQANNKGQEFEKKLNDYVKQLNELAGTSFKTLATPPKDIPLFASNEDHVRKDFLTFTFENTPVIAALTSVTQIQSEILDYEGRALRKLAEEAGAATVRFEGIIPMVRPKSETVAAGAPYEADLFISASSSTLSPQMAYEGKEIPIETDVSGVKMGKIKFTATGGNYNSDGLAKKTFNATITLMDSTYSIVQEYTVAKPVIRVTTGARPTLYMGACNPVNFEVPTLGTSYNPTINAQGGRVVRGNRPGAVTIVPQQRRVTVSVSNAGTFLGNEEFDVKPIPFPRILAKDNNGRDIDVKNGIRAGSLAGLRIIAQPDEGFKEFAPNDANYRIRSMEVILARGTQRVQTINATSETVDLSAWRAQMRPNDRITIDIKQVVRFPCSGDPERVPVNDVINIPIN